MIEVVLPIAVILLLVVVNGLFVAAEFALVGARRARLRTLADEGNGGARWLLGVIERPTGKDGYIAVAQLGITLASIGLGMYGEPAVAHWLYEPLERVGLGEEASHTAGFIVALSLITFLHVVFGEMIPKAIALAAPERTSGRVAPMMRFFSTLFRPAVLVLNWLALSLMRLIGIREPGKGTSLYTSEELAIVTEETVESGQLDTVQQRLINNIFELEDRTADQLMTSRGRLRAFDADTPVEEVARQIAAVPTSRYPVYERTLDHVIGVLHVKDFIRARTQGRDASLRALVRDLPSVGAATSAEDLLAMFKDSRVHAALVVDEFGGTLGFVTLDDLIADVIDEEDAEDVAWILRHPDGSLTLDGEVTLAELAENHGIDLRHDEVVTVAGLFLLQYGTVPEPGTVIRIGGHELVAEDISGLKITRVRLLPA